MQQPKNHFKLAEFSACRDMVINHQEVQFFFAFFTVDSRNQHTAGFNAHHCARRQVGNCNQGFADKGFRFIESTDTAEDGAFFAGAIIQSELQQFFALRNSFAIQNFYSTEVRFNKGIKDIKEKKAKELGVAIITEEEFQNMTK